MFAANNQSDSVISLDSHVDSGKGKRYQGCERTSVNDIHVCLLNVQGQIGNSYTKLDDVYMKWLKTMTFCFSQKHG